MALVRADAALLIGGVLVLVACGAGQARNPPSDGGGAGRAEPDACVACADDARVVAGTAGASAPPIDAPIEATFTPEAGAPEVALDVAAEHGASGCAGLFCEDFESGALDPAKWAVTSGVNHVDDATPPSVLETTMVAHGQYAAHFHGKGNVSNDDAFIVTKALPPALLTHHFGRLYFYVSVKPTSGHTMMVLGGSAAMSANPTLRDFEVATINGGWQLGFDQLNMSPSGEEVFYPTGQVPVAKWTCLEWEMNDAPDSDSLWIDGKSLGTLDDEHINYPSGHVAGAPIFNGKSSGLIGGFTTYSFGFYDWHPNVDFDIYYDDLVLDTTRVGCL
ncbi:MAG TPA: hypothetical protein VH560_12650 [Polyangia bacterium]|jgi:hypothetical protein|nr:hypothetical protein [Polyangia bacterium]